MLKYQFEPPLQQAQEKVDNMKAQVEQDKRQREQIEQLQVLDNRIRQMTMTSRAIAEHAALYETLGNDLRLRVTDK